MSYMPRSITGSARLPARGAPARNASLTDGALAAGVYVEMRGDRSYLGLLSVDPGKQKTGLGRRMVAAAEEFAREMGSHAMDMTVVNLRTELPPFYEKLGLEKLGIYVDPSGRGSRALAIPGVPTTLLIDRQGRETARKMGAPEWDGRKWCRWSSGRFTLDRPAMKAQIDERVVEHRV